MPVQMFCQKLGFLIEKNQVWKSKCCFSIPAPGSSRKSSHKLVRVTAATPKPARFGLKGGLQAISTLSFIAR